MADIVEVRYRFAHDRNATNRFLRDQKRVDDALEGQADAAHEVGQAHLQMEQIVERSAEAMRRSHEAQIDAARKTAEVYGDVASRTASFAALTSGLGGQALGGRMMIVSDILDATEAAKLLSAEIPKMVDQMAGAVGGTRNLTLGLGALGVAMAAGVIGFKLLTDAQKEATRTAEAWIDATHRFHEMDPYGLTSAQIDEQIAALGKITHARNFEISAVEEQIAALGAEANMLEQAGDMLGVWGEDLERYRSQRAELMAQNDADAMLMAQLVGQRESSIVAVNDMIAAEKELAEVRYTAGQRLVGIVVERAQLEETMLKRAASWTVDQSNQRLKQIEIEIRTQAVIQDGLDARLAAGDLEQKAYDEAMNASKDRVLALQHEQIEIERGILPAAEARAREAEAAKELVEVEKSRTEGLSTMAQLSLSLTEAEGQYLAQRQEILDSIGDQMQAARSKFQEQDRKNRAAMLTELQASEEAHQASLTELDEEHKDEELERVRDFARERARAEEDSRDRIADSAARLDAIAVMDELRSAEKDRKRAQEDFDQETDDRKAQHRQRKEQEEQAFDERQRARRQQYQTQRTELRTALRNELTELRASKRQQLTDLRTSYDQETALLRNNAVNRVATLTGFYSQEELLLQQHISRLTAIWQAGSMGSKVSSVMGSVSSVVSSAYGSVRDFLGSFQGGGYLPRDGVFEGHQGEWVADRHTAQALAGMVGGRLTQHNVRNLDRSQSVSIGQLVLGDVGGYSPGQIEQLVERGLIRALERTV